MRFRLTDLQQALFAESFAALGAPQQLKGHYERISERTDANFAAASRERTEGRTASERRNLPVAARPLRSGQDLLPGRFDNVGLAEYAGAAGENGEDTALTLARPALLDSLVNIAAKLHADFDGVLRVVAPEIRGPDARLAASVLRHKLAQTQRDNDRIQHALAAARKIFARRSKARK